MTTLYKQLPVDCLQRGRFQPRVHFEQTALQELAQSIQSQGLIEPLIVRKIADNRYEIIAGERRWRAAMLAGLTDVPCLLGEYSDEQAATLTLVENIQRQELNLIEEAKGYQQLSLQFHFQQDEIATLVGKSRSHVANILRLLSLCQPVQNKLCEGALSFGQARLLIGLPQTDQMNLAHQAIAHDWSVRKLEEKVRSLKQMRESPPVESGMRDIGRLQTILAEQMGAPVQIINENGAGGWLQIKFFDNDTLAGLLERMGLRYD